MVLLNIVCLDLKFDPTDFFSKLFKDITKIETADGLEEVGVVARKQIKSWVVYMAQLIALIVIGVVTCCSRFSLF